MDRHELPYIRVLLIEDDEDDYILIERLLNHVILAQYEVTWVQTCEDGLKEINEGVYDVCLLDYNLGSGSGLEVLSEVEECPKTPPIIVLTGLGKLHCRSPGNGIRRGGFSGQGSRLTGPFLNGRSVTQWSERSPKMPSRTRKDSSSTLRPRCSRCRKTSGECWLLSCTMNSASSWWPSNFASKAPWRAGASGESSASNLKSLIPSIQEAIERVRNMYTQLMPTVLDDLGILATLKWFCREFQKDHPDIGVESEFEVSEELISADLKLMIFRIVQEAFKNVADHSGSYHVRVKLIGENGLLRLDIEDDGKGFDVFNTVSPAGTNWGLGLMSMKRRAELSGGNVSS